MKQLLVIFVVSLLAVSCSDPAPKKQKPFNEERVKEPLVEANQNSVRTEDEDINLYVKRQQLDIVRSESGLRYHISKTGHGKQIKAKDVVTYSYQTFAIDGTLLYSSEKEGNKTVEVEKNNEIHAVDEALKLMRNGDYAHLVIPSHLAYGVAGDGDKIRQRIPIVMKIKVLNVKSSNKNIN